MGTIRDYRGYIKVLLTPYSKAFAAGKIGLRYSKVEAVDTSSLGDMA